MTERDIAAEVLRGFQEVREHRAGKRTLRETRIEATPIPELDPEMVDTIRQHLEGPESVVSQLLRESDACEPGPDVGGENGNLDEAARQHVTRKVQCAVTRRHSSAGANPARQLSLQPVAVGADDGGNDIA